MDCSREAGPLVAGRPAPGVCDPGLCVLFPHHAISGLTEASYIMNAKAAPPVAGVCDPGMCVLFPNHVLSGLKEARGWPASYTLI